MKHELPPLPYAMNALEPYLSRETLEYHYGKHHRAYVDNLNKLIPGTEYEHLPLEDIIVKASGPIFNNAAQVWNHTFYWNSLSPSGGDKPAKRVLDALVRDFGSFEAFKEAFSKAAVSLFGSGWVWLVQDGNRLDIVSTQNAGNPLTDGKKPLLTCDVWEHAYYIDYRNERARYVENFWKMANWAWVERHLAV
ncbi:MAG: superoxide dismutase [Nitrospirae bacterium]|nr:MAG: superoxide dismutase [Nitrospirota bacterium]